MREIKVEIKEQIIDTVKSLFICFLFFALGITSEFFPFKVVELVISALFLLIVILDIIFIHWHGVKVRRKYKEWVK
jgi:hypothetical protein